MCTNPFHFLEVVFVHTPEVGGGYLDIITADAVPPTCSTDRCWTHTTDRSHPK